MNEEQAKKIVELIDTEYRSLLDREKQRLIKDLTNRNGEYFEYRIGGILGIKGKLRYDYDKCFLIGDHSETGYIKKLITDINDQIKVILNKNIFILDYIVLRKIIKTLDCFEGVHYIDFDPRGLKDVGTMVIKICGVPKNNALEIWNDQ